MNKNNIIHFPIEISKIYDALEDALISQDYEAAIHYAQQLLHMEEPSAELIEAYCICLIETEQYDELVDFAIELEAEASYILVMFPYYIQALYELGKYRKLIQLYDQANETLQTMDCKFYYDLAYEMNQKQIEQQMKQYHRATLASEYQNAYRAMKLLIEASEQPSSFMLKQLSLPHVHPLIKTMILLYCRDKELDQDIEVEKFNQVKPFNMNMLQTVEHHSAFQEVMKRFADKEQENPALFEISMQLIEHYFTIMYPFKMKEEHIPLFTIAIERLIHDANGLNEELNRDIHDENEELLIEEYKKQIQFCSDIYMSIHAT